MDCIHSQDLLMLTEMKRLIRTVSHVYVNGIGRISLEEGFPNRRHRNFSKEYSLWAIVSWICRTCVSLYLATLIDKTLRRTVSLYSVLPCRRLSSDCRHVRHKPTIKPRSGAVLTLTIDYVIRSNLFNHLHMTGVRASPPLSSTNLDTEGKSNINRTFFQNCNPHNLCQKYKRLFQNVHTRQVGAHQKFGRTACVGST